jgi:hypothetical protein
LTSTWAAFSPVCVDFEFDTSTIMVSVKMTSVTLAAGELLYDRQCSDLHAYVVAREIPEQGNLEVLNSGESRQIGTVKERY